MGTNAIRGYQRVGGGLMDFGPRIESNISAYTLVNAPENIGHRTHPGPMEGNGYSPGVALPAVVGNWYKVEDSSVVVNDGYTSFAKIVWTLPDGRKIELKSDEINFQYENSWIWRTIPGIGNTTNIPVKDVTIKLTMNTVPGLAAFGIISDFDAELILGHLRKQKETEPTILGTTGKVASAVIIVAIVGALIWFVPRSLTQSIA